MQVKEEAQKNAHIKKLLLKVLKQKVTWHKQISNERKFATSWQIWCILGAPRRFFLNRETLYYSKFQFRNIDNISDASVADPDDFCLDPDRDP